MLELTKGPSVQESVGDVRILPSEMGLGPQLEEESFLVAYDPVAHEGISCESLAERIASATGKKCIEGVEVQLSWANREEILDPSSPENAQIIDEMIKKERPGQLGGYIGIYVVGEARASEEDVITIASEIAEFYKEDESPRSVHSYNEDRKNSGSITITGPNFNLADFKEEINTLIEERRLAKEEKIEAIIKAVGDRAKAQETEDQIVEHTARYRRITPFGIRKKARRFGRVALLSSAGPFIR